MKIATIIVRVLLVLAVVVFGLNVLMESIGRRFGFGRFGFRFGPAADTCNDVLPNPAYEDYSRAS